MSIHRIIQVAAALLILAGFWVVFATSKPADAGAESVPDTAPARTAPKPAVELKGEPLAKRAEPKKEDPGKRLVLPDGSTVPILNHAYGAPPMSWPQDRPWSPIIGKYTDPNTGEDWYMHQDGSRSTTQIRYHSHIGKMAPFTNVMNPAKTVPMAPDEVARVKEQQEKQAQEKKGGAKKN